MKQEMMTSHTTETLKQGMAIGLKAIFRISEFTSKPLKPVLFRVAFAVSLLFCAIIFITRISAFDTIQEIVSLSLNFLPGILGFTIGGYGFLIGFIQPALMDKISEPRSTSVFSLFQVASASFACNILIQGFALCLMYATHFIMWVDAKAQISTHLPYMYTNLVNKFGLIILAISFSMAVVVVLQLVVNVFNFSQLHHYNHNKGKLDQKLGALRQQAIDESSTQSDSEP